MTTTEPTPGKPARIAVVDDEPMVRRVLRTSLERDGYVVDEFDHGSTLASKGGAEFAAICLDLGLQDMNGLDVLKHLKAKSPEVPVIVVTGDNVLDSAIAAMRAGAFDYVTKPLYPNRLVLSVQRAIERSALERRVHALSLELEGTRAQSGSASGARTLVGQSPPMLALMQSIQRVVNSDVAVCVLGESGTGKELVARAIHFEGRRKKAPFVAINCASIPEHLQESELFGHERGAFTGATATQKGRFEQAEGGTLFLDELGDMTLATQVKLLRALQEKSIRRVGGTADIKIDVRVVAATHRDLEAMVRRGAFREDLYFRLMVYPIELPPLRERKGDIPLLVARFMERYREDVWRSRGGEGSDDAGAKAKSLTRISTEALDALVAHDWPGNVRELENIVHRAMLTSSGDRVEISDLPVAIRNPVLPAIPPPPTSAIGGQAGVDASGAARGSEDLPTLNLRELEFLAINAALKKTQGHIANAAKLVGLGRATLYRRIMEMGLKVDVARDKDG